MPFRSLRYLSKLFGIPKKIMLAGKLDSDINYMTVLIFVKFPDLKQVSVGSEMPILGQAPRLSQPRKQNTRSRRSLCHKTGM